MQNALFNEKRALEQALEQIRRVADSDELTGLLNRRAMVQVMHSEIRAIGSDNGPMCLALIDMDLFKSVSDRFGHQAGEEVLRMSAEVGKTTLRAGEMFARWGGEEFLLMLPDTSVVQGMACVERMRQILGSISFDHIQPGLRVTISAGVADLSPQDSLENAIERADQAMYRAKQLGRDQVVSGSLYSTATVTSFFPAVIGDEAVA